MNVAQLIAKKRDGAELSRDEIGGLIAAYAADELPDYQMAAWAMAVFIRGMTTAEIAALTEAMLDSGAKFAGSPAGGPPNADKHSSGGIGDKVSIPLAPALACCGVRVPMISGRGLGATGGTLDKLESIPGYRVDYDLEDAQRLADEVGCVIVSASPRLVPADRKLYALRDVTGTVPSIALITASIMSKKLAEGLDALVLDVKCGSGAFMKTLDDARGLARSLVDTGKRMGVATAALITDMNQPLGRLAGNAVEIDESVACLEGGGPADLRELVIAQGAEALVLAKVASSTEEGRAGIAKSLDDGSAREKLAQMVRAQGGDLDAPRPRAAEQIVKADRGGYVTAIDTEALGYAIIELGGGRKQKEDELDYSVGLEMLVRLGDRVEAGQPLVKLFANAKGRDAASAMTTGAITLSDEPREAPPLIVERVD
ncbi:thymidine phosphorylase [Botrimarina mediterranea]|uniref:thymidine phosphorylase n=1 Tax=Botrimarina mediterranea TaxID=2528022 RepID=A0A518K733_9BACT|nr:thymidine phosphorylase [Botrimarina mediterranea]QDV73611.1 Pyrimidine-nucleoside phosphorylase [Botrimarina mediterranea]QDV78201.1 Pyrimidine-nucleoside phosphorylase [Planctomycetes bacterium K2D]